MIFYFIKFITSGNSCLFIIGGSNNNTVFVIFKDIVYYCSYMAGNDKFTSFKINVINNAKID